MPPKEFRCKQCGHCCLNLEAHFTTVDESDIKLWKRKGREDILEWVRAIYIGKDERGKRQYVYDIWINPRTQADVSRCPWLRKLPKQNKYICKIHDVKPKVCREYPTSREHAEETGCKGFAIIFLPCFLSETLF